MNNIVIGKRIPAGQIIGGIVAIFAYFYNAAHPEAPLSADVVVSITTVAIGVTQLIIVNRFGVTQA